MPRCFCGEELEDKQDDMCTKCQSAVTDALNDFDAPEGVAMSLEGIQGIPLAGIVMPLEKAPPQED